MSDKISSLKLESFFHNLKVTKKASLGHFGDVITEDDMKTIAPMVHQMVMLPKYAKIKGQLQSANGVVNFVTYDEFEPLVEMVFKSAIPPSANDVYHMGQGFTLPEDYFINAKDLFGSPSKVPNASESLTSLLRGTPKLMSREWLKANGLDPEGTSFASVFGEAAQPIRDALTEYKKNKVAIENSDLKQEIDELFRQLDEDRVNRQEAIEVEKYNKGRPEAQRKPVPAVLSKEELTSLRKQLRLKRGFFAKVVYQLNHSAEADLLQIPQDLFGGFAGAEHNNDGFMNWSPDDEIRRVYMDILDSGDDTKREERMQVKLANLKSKLEDYRTTDPDLIQKKQRILDFLNVPNPAQKYDFNSGTFTRLMNEFVARANQHGKIMILNGVDNSGLTAPASEDERAPQGSKLNVGGALKEFIASNNAGMVRDMQGGKRTSSGKRTIILISDLPLQNLPSGATRIEMDVTPVDEAEAAIIVNSCVDSYVNDARVAASLKLAYDIEKKYANAKNSPQKDIEASQIPQIIAAARTRLAYVSPEGRKKMQQIIIGMGQKNAITSIRQTLASHVTYEADADGMKSGITFDEKTLIKDMIEDISKAKSKDVPGLKLRESKVKFQHYITKKESNWGDLVGDIALKAQAVNYFDQEIASIRKEISRLDFELADSKLSAATKQEKLLSRRGWQQEIDRCVREKEGAASGIPHYVILRGRPGVGKSVWGDALADLLDCLLYYVDLSDVKDMWLGNTEKFAKRLIDTIFSSRNCVFLIDEIDRMLQMQNADASGGGAGAQAHSTEKSVVGKFLEAFGEKIPELKDRGVYVIMTTNHLNAIDPALLSRAKGNVYDVQASTDPNDYLDFLKTFLETERHDTPNDPWIRAGGKTPKEMWDYTIKFVNENIDLPRLASVFATRQLSFRSLSGMIEKACRHHNTYINEFMGAISRGEQVEPHGMPLTTANMMNAAALVDDSASDATKVNLGIDDVYQKLLREARVMWPNVKLEETVVPHPVTGKPMKKFKLPADFAKAMDGKEEKDEDMQQFEVSEEEVTHPRDPNLKEHRVFLQPTTPGGKPKKNMQELQDTGIEEEPLVPAAQGPEQEKIDKGGNPADVKNKETKGKIASSTEYLYRYLINKGVVDDKGVIISKKLEEKPSKRTNDTVQNVPQAFDELEQYGTYYFNEGQVVVMSIDEGVPPLRFL